MKKIVRSFNSILMKIAAMRNRQMENIIFERAASSAALKTSVLNNFILGKYSACVITYNTGNKIRPAETSRGAIDISQRLVNMYLDYILRYMNYFFISVEI
jgi:hypothetical protein